MAKKSTKSTPAADRSDAVAVKTTKARQSTVPPKTKARVAGTSVSVTIIEITNDMIAERAYHLWRNGMPGGELDHWIAAERELRSK